jgi:hypothetical protein
VATDGNRPRAFDRTVTSMFDKHVIALESVYRFYSSARDGGMMTLQGQFALGSTVKVQHIMDECIYI